MCWSTVGLVCWGIGMSNVLEYSRSSVLGYR